MLENTHFVDKLPNKTFLSFKKWHGTLTQMVLIELEITFLFLFFS